MYDYGNARLRAVKSRLLSQSEIKGFANSSDLQDLIKSLLGTSYRRSLESALSHGGGVKAVTKAAQVETSNLVDRIRKYYEGRAGECIRLILHRFDVDNVKTILRGLENRLDSNEIARAFTTFGELDKELLMEVASAGDPRDAMDTMASMQLFIAPPLVAYRVEHPGARVQEFETALEHWYVQNTAHELRKAKEEERALLEALKLNADLFNLMMVFRFVHAPKGQKYWEDERDMELGDLFLEEGNLSISKLMDAVKQNSMERAMRMFESSAYKDALANGLDIYRRSKRLSDIERELQNFRLEWMRKQIIRDPLGISVPMGVLALKANETANIRWVAWGLQMGLEAEEIEEELEFIGE